MSVSFWNDFSASTRLEVDVAIIGGGIAGLSCAYWLSKEDPSLKIAILEKHQLGSGATGRNAGFITCGSVEHFNRMVSKHGTAGALEIWRFSETNMRLLKEEIIRDEDETCGFRQQGTFSLASSATEFSELQASAALMEKHGVKIEILQDEQIRSRLGARGFAGGIKYCEDGSVNPIRLLQLIRTRLPCGVLILENQEVHRIGSASDKKIVFTDKSKVEATIVVMASNGYSPLLHPFFVDKIFPTRGQILCTEAVAPFMEGPCYANFVLDYFRQLPTGEVIIGGFRQLQKDAGKGYSDDVSEVIQNALSEFLREHLPRLNSARVTHRWTGIMGFSADGQPLVGSLPNDPSVFFCGGFTGHGMGLAFHAGKVLADCVYGRTIPDFISARRF